MKKNEISILSGRAGSSAVVESCQICGNPELDSIFFLGYLPPVNRMNPIGEKPHEQPAYPAELLFCPTCRLVQLGLVVDPAILFPPEYPYTSSTTKILRENFAELYRECSSILDMKKDDLVVDIGSNDGNLLSNFKDRHRVLGITPEEIGKIAIGRGIPTVIDYFTEKTVSRVIGEHGHARLVTATNVFAHIDNVNAVVEQIMRLLGPGGVFISESHYLLPLIETLQYDTIYHEHLRYYSLHSLRYLLESHGLEIFHAKRIPTHGGSIRVYAARKGDYPVKPTVEDILKAEAHVVLDRKDPLEFKKKVVVSKLKLQRLFLQSRIEESAYMGSAPLRGRAPLSIMSAWMTGSSTLFSKFRGPTRSAVCSGYRHTRDRGIEVIRGSARVRPSLFLAYCGRTCAETETERFSREVYRPLAGTQDYRLNRQEMKKRL